MSMREASIPKNEEKRLSALKSLNILDTPPEERFDRITRIAQYLFNAPICIVSLIDSHRVWFKSRQGLDETEFPRAYSFCSHTLLEEDALVVPDTMEDQRFFDNPRVTGKPYIRFYAGQPIRSADGHSVGAFCIMDTKRRHLTEGEKKILRDIAVWAEIELNMPDLKWWTFNERKGAKEAFGGFPKQLKKLLETRTTLALRKINEELQREIKKRRLTEKALLEIETKYHEVVERTDNIVCQIDPMGRVLYVNDAVERILGLHKEELTGADSWQIVHPDDRERSQRTFEEWKAKKILSAKLENRLIDACGQVHQMLWTVNPHYNDHGHISVVNAIGSDITERKKHLEQLQTLYAQLNIEKQRLERLLNIGHSMQSILDINRLVDFIIEKTTEILEAGKCSLMLLDPETNELLIRGAVGLDDEIIKNTRIKLGDPIAGLVAREGNPLLVTDIETDYHAARKNRPHYLTKSFLSAPLIVHGKLEGVVNVADKKSTPSTPPVLKDGACSGLTLSEVEESKTENVFTEVDLKILATIMRQAATAIENANYCRTLEHLSATDSLTALHNHRSFLIALDRELDRLKRYPKPLCLLMLDIDDFKSYNDTYGHLEGDYLLKALGTLLKENLRSVDIVCRYAGDEFVAILPETDIPQAELIAQKLKNALTQQRSQRKVTVSIGIARSSPDMNRRDLIMKADQALYQSKRGGKNKISCFY